MHFWFLLCCPIESTCSAKRLVWCFFFSLTDLVIRISSPSANSRHHTPEQPLWLPSDRQQTFTVVFDTGHSAEKAQSCCSAKSRQEILTSQLDLHRFQRILDYSVRCSYRIHAATYSSLSQLEVRPCCQGSPRDPRHWNLFLVRILHFR